MSRLSDLAGVRIDAPAPRFHCRGMKGHARNLMTEHVLALRPEMSLAEIARVLVAAQHGGAPVVDEHQRVIGFISEIDLLDAFLAQRTSTATAPMMSPAISRVMPATPRARRPRR